MNKRIKVLPLAAAVALVMSGCVSNPQVSDLQRQLAEQQKENQALKANLDTLKQQKQAPAAPAPAPSQPAMSAAPLLPPNAKPGECYARVWVPPQYKTVEDKILVREAGERTEVIPAKYEWTTEKVLVKEASSRLEKVPAVYTTETETIKVRDAQRVWKTGLGRKAAPASKELLAAAKSHGIDLDAAKPGMCFHEHYRPARYETVEQQVLVSDADTRVKVSAPKYRWVEKRVMVSEPSYRIEKVPAVYEWTEEKVIDTPAHTTWKKGTGPIQKIDEATGEIMCLVEVPATYKIVRKRVLKTPATTRKVEIPAKYKTIKVRELVQDAEVAKQEIPARYKTIKIKRMVSGPEFVWHEVHQHGEPTSTRTGNKICLTEIPAQYKTVTRRVLKSPATTRKVEIPAVYKTVKVRKLVAEPQVKHIPIPAKYKTVTHRELAKEGYMEWRSILCKTNMTGTRITQIQRALKREGYDPGPIDGVIGRQTIAAINAFERAKGLPVDKYINIKTLNALGVSAK